ncbi:hypothetical protein WN51_03552 [Melipona quadrifasciata]|uniref:Uncharacterized protein n=1 Tax=Melipona quadrifasciata TaxID=166423 RepID=A0A0N0BDV8_9HYME|nr:hypothetical protein WN51_03552 [Melipona quadrifasciata]
MPFSLFVFEITAPISATIRKSQKAVLTVNLIEEIRPPCILSSHCTYASLHDAGRESALKDILKFIKRGPEAEQKTKKLHDLYPSTIRLTEGPRSKLFRVCIAKYAESELAGKAKAIAPNMG